MADAHLHLLNTKWRIDSYQMIRWILPYHFNFESIKFYRLAQRNLIVKRVGKIVQ